MSWARPNTCLWAFRALHNLDKNKHTHKSWPFPKGTGRTNWKRKTCTKALRYGLTVLEFMINLISIFFVHILSAKLKIDLNSPYFWLLFCHMACWWCLHQNISSMKHLHSSPAVSELTWPILALTNLAPGRFHQWMMKAFCAWTERFFERCSIKKTKDK